MAGIFDRFDVQKNPTTNLIAQNVSGLLGNRDEAKNRMANNVMQAYAGFNNGERIGAGNPSVVDQFQRMREFHGIQDERDKGIASIKDMISKGGTEGFKNLQDYYGNDMVKMLIERLQLAGRNNQI